MDEPLQSSRLGGGNSSGDGGSNRRQRRGGSSGNGSSGGGSSSNTGKRRKPERGGANAEEEDENKGAEGGRNEVNFTLLIPNEFIGSVLGRGGATIKRLQWQTHTTIRCSSSAEGLYPGTSSRVVTLSSASAAALDAAQSLILLAVAQGYGDAFREVGIVISDIAAGRIIGRAGAQIATLREGCERCELTPRNESSHERMVIISGDVAQMTFTVRGIIDLIMETLSERLGDTDDHCPQNETHAGSRQR